MVFKWEPQTRYESGTVVEYEGHKYKIIQPHQSQSDWTPPVTPALWSRLPEDYEHSTPAPPPEKNWNHDKPSYQPEGGFCAPHPNQDPNLAIPQEEREKKWYDLDDHRKKELEIGGGLLVGAAALGAGFFAYKHHEKAQEDQKATAWALQNYLHEAQRRTDEFNGGGGRGPVTWVLNQGRKLPFGIIPGGQDQSGTLYIARAFQDGGVEPGKASETFTKGALISFGHHEIEAETFEVLVAKEGRRSDDGLPEGVKWVDVSGEFDIQNLGGDTPIEGGRDTNGARLYIAQVPYHDSVHPGKVGLEGVGALCTVDGKVREVKSQYRILCYDR